MIRPSAARALVGALAALGLVGISACTGPSLETRRARAEAIADAAGFESVRYETSTFPLVGFLRPASLGATERLRIYIEGDGASWRTSRWPSSDPTPRDPLALRLATRDPGPEAVLYLARPCQYGGASDPPCGARWWTDARFAPEIVVAFDEAIDAATRDPGASSLELVGYSGGGVVAALVAARRPDVASLITVASPLAVASWARRSGASPLKGSLDPADEAAALASVRQVHFAGAEDERVRPEEIEVYRAALAVRAPAVVIRVPDHDHECCWATTWPELLHRAHEELGTE